MNSSDLTPLLGEAVQDAAEETFLLFSQSFPSHNLGFVNEKGNSIELDIADRTLVVRQSPGLLTSNRESGTTGAVLWKITPLVASWLVSMPKLLDSCKALHSNATVVELGCGITGLIGLTLAPKVASYILTDQSYVMKTLRDNISSNQSNGASSLSSKAKGNSRGPKVMSIEPNLKTLTLDWEQDSVENLRQEISPSTPIDLVIACDCVYNEHLVQPLVQTCVDISRLGSSTDKPTVIMVAQQLRSESVFESFLEALLIEFNVWRVGDEQLPAELQASSGYVIHLATKRNDLVVK